MTTEPKHHMQHPSAWVRRWSHLLPARGTVLDVACGQGRHMRWLAEQGHRVTGVDRSSEALAVASAFGNVVQADIEGGDWPLLQDGQPQRFDAVVVTNYLWRELFSVMLESLAPGGVLLYETFAVGNETVGKPSRPDFLLQPGELLRAFSELRIVGYEDGYLTEPARFVQRLAAVRPSGTPESPPARYLL